jgi:hypothetical protein
MLLLAQQRAQWSPRTKAARAFSKMVEGRRAAGAPAPAWEN